MTIAPVVHATANGPANFTTPVRDTTGATLLTLKIGSYAATAGLGNFSDSISGVPTGNMWTALTDELASGISDSRLFYCENPIVGPNHTVTSSGLNFDVLEFQAWSGTPLSSVLDQQNGATGSSSTAQAGSVTPSTNNQLLIAGLCAGISGTVSMADSGWAILDQTPYAGANNLESAVAYKIQTTAGAENPTWSGLDGSFGTAAVIATFKAATGGDATTLSEEADFFYSGKTTWQLPISFPSLNFCNEEEELSRGSVAFDEESHQVHTPSWMSNIKLICRDDEVYNTVAVAAALEDEPVNPSSLSKSLGFVANFGYEEELSRSSVTFDEEIGGPLRTSIYQPNSAIFTDDEVYNTVAIAAALEDEPTSPAVSIKITANVPGLGSFCSEEELSRGPVTFDDETSGLLRATAAAPTATSQALVEDEVYNTIAVAAALEDESGLAIFASQLTRFAAIVGYEEELSRGPVTFDDESSGLLPISAGSSGSSPASVSPIGQAFIADEVYNTIAIAAALEDELSTASLSFAKQPAYQTAIFGYEEKLSRGPATFDDETVGLVPGFVPTIMPWRNQPLLHGLQDVEQAYILVLPFFLDEVDHPQSMNWVTTFTKADPPISYDEVKASVHIVVSWWAWNTFGTPRQ